MKTPKLSTRDILYISFGGILGSLLRTWIGWGFEGGFPVPTILVNVLGACALAILYGSQHRIHPQGRYLYMVGFCGSFTTVSLFSYETVVLLESGQAGLALLNIAIPVILSLSLVAWIIPKAEKFMERAS
jgi:CrcB protein